MNSRKNHGFTLVEVMVIISIMAILLGIMAPSMNAVLGFQAQKATQSVTAALDHMKMEAMSRLVGEMKLEFKDDGYYVTYYLDRGKGRGLPSDAVGTDGGDQAEKIAGQKVLISYVERNKDNLSDAGTTYDLKEKSLILTVNRENGEYRPIQTGLITGKDMDDFLAEDNQKDLRFPDSDVYCSEIIITCGMRSRIITLNHENGTYTVKSNN